MPSMRVIISILHLDADLKRGSNVHAVGHADNLDNARRMVSNTTLRVISASRPVASTTLTLMTLAPPACGRDWRSG